jgi:hypothetical protein
MPDFLRDNRIFYVQARKLPQICLSVRIGEEDQLWQPMSREEFVFNKMGKHYDEAIKSVNEIMNILRPRLAEYKVIAIGCVMGIDVINIFIDPSFELNKEIHQEMVELLNKHRDKKIADGDYAIDPNVRGFMDSFQKTNFRLMAKCEKPLRIVIKNPTEKMRMIKIWSIDHNLMYHGRKWPKPVPVCGGEMAPGKEWKLMPRKYNQPPHRYFIAWYVKKDGQWVFEKSGILVITPKVSKVVIYPDKVEKYVGDKKHT